MIFERTNNNAKPEGNELKKYRHKKRILRLLYRHEQLSATEISKQLGVSLPTALSNLQELSSLHFIEVKGTGKSSGGRKPTMLGLSDDSLYIIACELGRYSAKLSIFNPHNKQVVPMVNFETNIDDEKLVEKVYNYTEKLIKQAGIDHQRIFGLGVAMPGLVDEAKGINYTIQNPAFRNVKERFENKFGKFVYINNDARMQAYGEYFFGAAQGHSNAIIVNWSWGVGLGMIMDGKLYSGATSFSGELSHIKLEQEGNLCICGKRGCLETATSAYVLVNEAIKGIKNNTISQLTETFKRRTNKLTPDDVINAAKSGDEFSIQLLHRLGLALGKGLAVTIQLLNPDIIVLGGPISNAKQFVLTSIQQSLNRHCLEQIVASTKLVVSDIWEKSGLLGITAMMYQTIFSDIYE